MSKTNEINVTPAEWNVLECLWGQEPQTSRAVVDSLKASMGWSKSTTLTMLRRMTEKGLTVCDESGEVRRYAALVNRDAALLKETDDFLNRVYKGSIGLLMSTLTKKESMSKAELDELYEILRQAEEQQTRHEQ